MSRTTTRRPGRLRAIAVASALAVSMIAGVASPAVADDVPPAHANGPASDAPGLNKTVDARDNAANAPWNRFEEDDSESYFTPQGISWF